MFATNPTSSDPQATRLTGRICFLSAATLLLFAGGWCGWFYPFDDLVDRAGTPLGADFPAFYLAGQMMLEGQTAELYDSNAAYQRLHEMFPTMRPGASLPYRYPPFVALAMVPLAALPYPAAFFLFTCASVGLLVVSFRWLSRDLTCLQTDWGLPIWLVALGVPVVLETLAGGQAAMWAVGIAAATVSLLRRGRTSAAGAILALALYKPNLLAVFALACWLRYPKLWRGAVPAVLALAGVSMAAVGWQGVCDYVEVTRSLASNHTWQIPPPDWKFHSLEPLADWLVPGWGKLSLTLGGVLAATAIVVWWRRLDTPATDGENAGVFDLSLGLLLLVQTISNPYLPIYDLSLLVIATPLVIEGLWLRHGEALCGKLLLGQVCLGWIFFGPHLSQAAMLAGGAGTFSLGLLVILVWLIAQRPMRYAYQQESPASG